MLKTILRLEGAQKLSKKEQKSLNGGVIRTNACPYGTHQCEDSGPLKCIKNGIGCP